MHSPRPDPLQLSLLDLFNATSILLGSTTSQPTRTKLGQPLPSFSSILSSRLSLLSTSYPTLQPATSNSLLATDQNELHLLTAQTALEILEQINHQTIDITRNKQRNVPTFSVNQIKLLQTLGGVVARWGIVSQLDKEERILPLNLYHSASNATGLDKGKGKERFEELDLEKEQEKEESLKRVIQKLMDEILFNHQDELKMIIMPQVVLPLVGAIIHLLTKEEKEEEQTTRREYENYLNFIFNSNPLTVLLSHLLQLVSTSRPQSLYRSLLTTHLSSLLLRPGGVRSLLIVVVGVSGQEEETASEKKSEMVWKLLGNHSTGQTDDKVYYSNILSQLLTILSSSVQSSLLPANSTPPPSTPPPSILLATCYLLSHFLLSPHHTTHSPLILSTLHRSFLPLTYSHPSQPSSPSVINQEEFLKSLTRLSILISNAPQLPNLRETLIPSSILTNCFSLVSFLEETERLPLRTLGEHEKMIERMKEEVKSILYIIGKTLRVGESGGEQGEGQGELVRNVRESIEMWEKGEEFGAKRSSTEFELIEEEGEWRVIWGWTERGQIEARWINDSYDHKRDEGIQLPSPVVESESESDPTGMGAMNSMIRVNPEVVVDWLKEVGRKELSASLFLRWLDELRVLQQEQAQFNNSGTSCSQEEQVELAKKSVVRLQLILKMVEKLGSDILTSPKEIVAFIGNTLDVGEESDRVKHEKKRGEKNRGGTQGGLGLEDLRIVDDEEEDEEEEVEVRELDVGAGLGVGSGKEELVMTAITLLLAVLEANPDLSISSTPLLRSINSRLSHLSETLSTTSELIPPLLREAQMVLQLRETSLQFSPTPGAGGGGKARELDGMESSRTKYQEALKLLQDPLLPVRAQGLHLLKSLIKPKDDASVTDTDRNLLKTDPALLPAILDIFLNSLTEEDSFLYLNAVQGLSILVDVFGRQVVRGLLEVYTGGTRRGGGSKIEVKEVGEGEKGQREVDKRLRVGEALVQVVQRAGEALATLQDLLLPPLLVTLRQSTLPIPLRASAITVLATMVETSPLAMMRVAGELGEAMRQLLEIETVSYRANPTIKAAENESAKKKGKGKSSVLIEEVKEGDSTEEDEEEEEDFTFSLPTLPKSTSNPHSARPEELADPTTTSSKHPSLRRAALLFLSLLVRTMIKTRYESFEKAQKEAMQGLGESLVNEGRLRMPGDRPVIESRFDRNSRNADSDEGMNARERERLKITLEFVRETDKDELVRFQAGELLEELQDAGM